MLHIDNSIRKMATGLYNLFGDENTTIDHFMCSAASGLYDNMRIQYQEEFEMNYAHLCMTCDLRENFENNLNCHE